MYSLIAVYTYLYFFVEIERVRGGGLKGKGRSSNPGVRFAGFNYILRLLLSLVSLGLKLRAHTFGGCAK